MSAPTTQSLVLTFEEARRVVEEHASRLRPEGSETAGHGVVPISPEIPRPADENAGLRDDTLGMTVKLGRYETVELLHAAGRVLAEAIVADRDMPPFARATRDGYAVRAADLVRLPARLKVIGEIKAGPVAGVMPEVKRGETCSIMTGAPAPAGADAVVMVEYTALVGAAHDATSGAKAPREKSGLIAALKRCATPNQSTSGGGEVLCENRASVDELLGHDVLVEVGARVVPGENIVARGAEARQGARLLDCGTRLNEAAVAVAASVGKARVQVFVRPRVAILTTGDEIVAVDAQPDGAQIRNSNSYSLAVQVEQAGGEVVLLPIAPDEPRRLRQLIEKGLECDLLIMTGGVSMGRYDLVEQALGELQAEFFFTGAKIQPGRPVVFGRVPCGTGGSAREAASVSSSREGTSVAPAYKYFFGLPGNPVSTMVTFELFARPMIEALAGMRPSTLRFLHARLKSEIRVKTGLKRFLPAALSGEFEESQVELVAWQGSGDIAARSRANCYVVVPADREHIAAGEWVAVMLR